MFRAATSDDADAIARIYNEGIEDRLATFETRLRSTDEIAERIRSTDHPLVVAVDDGRVLAWAGTGMYRDRQCYAGVAEFSFYVAREARRRGIGTAILRELVRVAEERGFWKLVSRIFPENAASLRACAAAGFRVVGTYRSHAQLDGEWRDVVIVERLMGPASAASTVGQELRPARLDHVVIAVSDRERSNDFYRRVLGAELVEISRGRWAYRLGDQQLNVHGPGSEAIPVAREPVRPGNSDLCFVWDGPIAAAAAHLERNGVAVELGTVPRTGGQGDGTSVYFRDPDGSLLEFISYIKDAAAPAE